MFLTDPTWTRRFRYGIFESRKLKTTILKDLFILNDSNDFYRRILPEDSGGCMKKRKFWKTLAAAGSFAVLLSTGTYAGPIRSEGEARGNPKGEEHTVFGSKDCRRLLLEEVSSVSGPERCELYVTGVNYEPETLVIAQMFPEIVNISNTKIKEWEEEGKTYMTCRIGFERRPGEEACTHSWNREVLEEGTCLWGQKERLICELCRKETVMSKAPPGHKDTDQDLLCDRCGDRMEAGQEIEKRFWEKGEIQTRKMGNNTYRFRCVDDDYRSENSDYQRCALFLCETVIRSDFDSTDSRREILTFGNTNNYKDSLVRKKLSAWAKEEGSEGLPYMNTGVNYAFFGKTRPETGGETAETELTKRELPLQVVWDQIFLLSVEEALRYRDELWEVSGEVSPYSRGYWLRTPLFAVNEKGEFFYGTWVYAVDLEEGTIRPAEVSDGSMGIRPAYCIPQA